MTRLVIITGTSFTHCDDTTRLVIITGTSLFHSDNTHRCTFEEVLETISLMNQAGEEKQSHKEIAESLADAPKLL